MLQSGGNQMINKSDAIRLIAMGQTSCDVNKENSFFANINKRKEVWWIGVPESKIKPGRKGKLNFLLLDCRNQQLHHLSVPIAFFQSNRLRLAEKDGRDTISLELSANSQKLYKDVRPKAAGVDFKRYLRRSVNVSSDNVPASVKKGGAYQKRRRNQRKEEIIKSKGGACSKCGYSKSASALVFHHRNEKAKAFNISGQNLNKYSWELLLKEAKKCDLLCANCHAEVHDKEGWIHEDGKRTVKTSRII